MTATEVRFDPYSPEFRADPYPFYDALREAAPVHYSADWNMWVLTRYDDCDAVLHDRRFGQGRGVLATPPEGQRRIYEFLSHTMLGQDPPDHTRLRSLVNKAFAPRQVARLRPALAELAGRLLGEARVGAEMDLVADFASPLSLAAMVETLGLPREDGELFRGWSAAMIRIGDLTDEAAVYERATAALADFSAYMEELVDRRRREPRDDLLSALVAAARGQGRLSEKELHATVIHTFGAGLETTNNFIGLGVLALVRHPGELRKLRADPDLVKPAVEELLRYDSPVQMTSRFALADVELRGHLIRAGQQVGVALGAANRDPRRFENPATLDLKRKPRGHMTLGHGIHYCLGAPLARLEGQVVLEALLERAPGLRLASEELEYHDNYAQRGLKALPVLLNGC